MMRRILVCSGREEARSKEPITLGATRMLHIGYDWIQAQNAVGTTVRSSWYLII